MGRTTRQRVQNVFDYYNLVGVSLPLLGEQDIVMWEEPPDRELKMSLIITIWSGVSLPLLGEQDTVMWEEPPDREFKISLIITIWWGFPCPY